MIHAMKNNPSLLGGLTVEQFLHDYWQKKPLLIRQAFPAFSGLLDPRQLIALACAEDVQARLVTKQRGNFELDKHRSNPKILTGLLKPRAAKRNGRCWYKV